jgi:hypothetical protein
MTMIRDPKDCGFARRLFRIYRENRRPQPVKEYTRDYPWTPTRDLRAVKRRMPRRSAWQIAWHQARNAQGLGTQE